MKTIIKNFMGAGLIFTLLTLFSFSGPNGGDSYRVYFNDKLMLEQFVHMDKSVRNLELPARSENGQVDVYYSHCGKVGKNRYLTIQDENRRPIHVWEYPDAVDGAGAMNFTVKQVMPLLKNKEDKFFLSYSSRELPKGITIASFSLENYK